MNRMETTAPDNIKHREICFCSLHPDTRQAHSVMLLLSDIDGILGVTIAEPECLHVSYDISRLSLKIIEDALIELGYHLDNSLLARLKRALYYYSEDVQRANLGCGEEHVNHTQDVFINRYQRLRHGCRDDRPEYWRKYL